MFAPTYDADGNAAATYDYAPFGAVSAGTPSGSAAPANPFQFSSEVYDSELGLVYYNYRHCSPTDGRWLSRDPIEEQGLDGLFADGAKEGGISVNMLGSFKVSYKIGIDCCKKRKQFHMEIVDH